MNCTLCKNGITAPGKVNVMLERGESIVIVKGVPAEVCDNCGEYYLSEAITHEVLRLADGALNTGAEVEVVRFAA